MSILWGFWGSKMNLGEKNPGYCIPWAHRVQFSKIKDPEKIFGGPNFFFHLEKFSQKLAFKWDPDHRNQTPITLSRPLKPPLGYPWPRRGSLGTPPTLPPVSPTCTLIQISTFNLQPHRLKDIPCKNLNLLPHSLTPHHHSKVSLSFLIAYGITLQMWR